jgi:ribosomal protein L7/L12
VANAFKEEQQRKREEALMQKCRQLISSGQNIRAIKEYRSATGCGLEAAQRALGLR